MPKFTEEELAEIRANTERIERERQERQKSKPKTGSSTKKSKSGGPNASLRKRLRVFQIMAIIILFSALVWLASWLWTNGRQQAVSWLMSQYQRIRSLQF